MNSSLSYERVVKARNTGKRLAVKISVILAYVIVAVLFLIAAVSNLKNVLPILAIGALVTFALIKITWKYLQLEFEYSFSYGTLCISKIYGKSTRRQMVEADIKSLLMVAPATKENIDKAERLEAEDRIIAVSSEAAENIWLALTGDKDERRLLVFFEADERSLSILKAVNPYAFSKRV